MANKQNGTRCKGRNKAGKPCRAFATAGGLCFFHTHPDKASELGRIGGRKNRHIPVDLTIAHTRLNSATGLLDTGACLIEDVIAGKRHPRIASGLAPLLNFLLRAIVTSDLERRLAALEKGQAEAAPNEGSHDTTTACPDSAGAGASDDGPDTMEEGG